jgi:hypothetical protein
MLRNFGPFDGSGSLRPRHAVAKPARANPSRGSAPQSSPARGNDDPSAAGLSRRSVCVRLCDGYFFPVGDYSGSSDDDAHQAICSGLCPGAPTRLFVMPSGSDKIEDAISAREKRPYTALPVAFRHTTKHDNTCSCRAQEASVNDSVSLLKDFTLRRGDRIMTGQGFRVFLGSSNRVFKQNDFVSLAQFREIDSHERGSLQAIEKASGVNHTPVALISPKKADAKAIPLTIAPARTFTDSHGKTVRMIGPQAWMANGDAKAD